jgi:hypothetical protein
MKGRPLVIDPNALSAKAGEPAFVARPDGTPVYHGIPIIEESETDGWKYGAITAYEGLKEENQGDGFVVAPDGSRAGIVWNTSGVPFSVILPPSEGRWGVYGVRFPKAVSSRQHLIQNFRAVLPQLKARFADLQNNG